MLRDNKSHTNHNKLPGLQGGTTDELYHLTEVNYNILNSVVVSYPLDSYYIFDGYVGIGTSIPTSTLEVSGSIATSISTKTSDYVMSIIDSTILLDGTSNTVTSTLPTAVGITGRVYNIKCINDIFTCTVNTTNSQLIDGELAIELIMHETITIQSDGTNWWII